VVADVLHADALQEVDRGAEADASAIVDVPASNFAGSRPARLLDRRPRRSCARR
jgi:hypothetical protein